MMFWFVVMVAALSLFGGLIYRRVWVGIKGMQSTPTGYGALLSIFLVAGTIHWQASVDLIWSYVLVAVAAAIYWSDDVLGLGVRLRISIQFVSGFAVCYLLLSGTGLDLPLSIACCVAAGALNVVLTNVINFTDGADLNLAALMVLTAVAVLLIGPDAAFMQPSALIILAFVLPFALLNCRPRTLYFGDSGCFVFASFITIMTVCYFRNGAGPATFAALPMALPVYDAFYVFVTRVRNKEDLLSRNYLHLYQKLQIKYRNFTYLLPQPLNIALVLVSALVLQALGLPELFAVTLAMLSATPVFYAIYRRLFLR